jgi:hypothetical protein
MRNYSGSRAAIFTSPLSPAFDPFLYQALLFYLQPLSLLFPTLRSSALPGENTAVSERSYGPDWHCGTLLGHSHSRAKSQPHAAHSASEPWLLGSQGHPIIEAVFGIAGYAYRITPVLVSWT